MTASSDQDSMPVAFISVADDQLPGYGDSARHICTRHDVDPDATGWPETTGIKATELVQERIGAASLFVGIYQRDAKFVSVNGSGADGSSLNATEFELAAACELLKREDVFCFIQKCATRSQGLELMLRKFEQKYTAHEFESEADFKLLLDQTVKAWRSRAPAADRGYGFSIQIECPDRYGVLASLADRIFREGGNIMRAEHRNQHGRSFIRVIADWPLRFEIDHKTIAAVLAKALKDLSGRDDASVSVVPLTDGVRTVTNRSVFKIMFWDGPGVAERLFAVMASERVSVVESQLVTIPATPQLGRLELVIDSGGAPDNLLSLIQDKLKKQPNVFIVERSTERGQWWY